MENTGFDMAITIPETPDGPVRRIKVKRSRPFQETGEKGECSDTRTENGDRSRSSGGNNALFKKKDKGKSISTDPCTAHVAASSLRYLPYEDIREVGTSSNGFSSCNSFVLPGNSSIKGKEKADRGSVSNRGETVVDLSCDRQQNRGTKRMVRHGCISPRPQIGCTTAGGSKESEVTAIRSSGEPSSSRLPIIQNHQRQMEADEILARELQEQLYHEEMLIRDERQVHFRINENIARLLEQEEIALHASSSTRLFPRNSHTRFHYLEEEEENETGHNISNSNLLRMVDRTEDRYELLLAPEGNSHTRFCYLEGEVENENGHSISNSNLLRMDDRTEYGIFASEGNNLPESTVQTDNFQEPCAICLETPTVGDTIRHLPCLHKFHKDCIDPWLGRSMLCPLCKSSITTT